MVDQHDDVLLHLAAEHPLDDFHRLFVGDTHTLHETALLADLFERVVNLRPTAVNDHRVHADQFQQDHVAREAMLEALLGHRVAAVFDDDGLAVKLADVGQGLSENLGLDSGSDGGQGHCNENG